MVTYHDPAWSLLFIQDESAGIFVLRGERDTPLVVGSQVEVNGVAAEGLYAPIVREAGVTVVGRGKRPEPHEPAVARLATGLDDSSWVAVAGTVRSTTIVDHHLLLDLATLNGRCNVYLPGFSDSAPAAHLVDAEVRAQGVCVVILNDHHQPTGFKLLTPSLDDVTVIRAAPADPFTVPLREVRDAFQREPARDHRIRLSGIVTLRQAPTSFFLQDDTGGLTVLCRADQAVEPGERVEVVGFLEMDRSGPQLQEAILRRISVGPLPEPLPVTPAQALHEGAQGKLVSLEAHLEEVLEHEGHYTFLVRSGERYFEAQLAKDQTTGLPSPLVPGSLLRLTGICLVQTDERGLPQSFRLLLRTGDDLLVVRGPPWWTVERALTILGGSSICAAAALLWIVSLRRQVRRQTVQIHQRLQHEASLEAKYRGLFENAHDIIYTHDLEGNLTALNRAGQQILGYRADEAIGMNIARLVAPEQLELARQMTARKAVQGGTTHYELQVLAKDGHRVDLEISSWIVRREGEPVRVEGIARDIRERKRAEQALHEQQAILRNIIDHSPCAIFWKDRRSVYLGCNQQSARDLGLGSPEQAVGKTDYDMPFAREEAAFYTQCDRQVMESGEPLLHIEETQQRPDGQQAALVTSKVPLRNEHGEVVGILGVYTDITERKRIEEALRQSEERYRSVVQGSLQGILINQDGRICFANAALVRMFGYDSPDDLLGRETDELAAPEERPALLARRAACLRGDAISPYHEWQGLRRDGTRVWVQSTVTAISWNGRPALLSSRVDITERKHLEEQLRQAQKMEAVGRLAGGIAHDFNNLLTIITGYSDLMLRELSPLDPSREPVQQIHRAGERAAALTRQLLAFSRKQVLAPVPLHLNTVVRDMEKMLRRTIGEDVELVTHLEPDLGKVLADPGQIEQVILNLAVNSRDAMPNGGRLTLGTSQVHVELLSPEGVPELAPGEYVELLVRDTGCGMDERTQARIFEPFFTTKEVGKGTGLGLATVYGIVTQSNGHITVESRVGQGTTFRVYLPRVAASGNSAHGESPGTDCRRGRETVLLVEDEEWVRTVIRHALRLQGYTVLAASHGDEALALAKHHQGPIHLLVTDVVMPRMNGRELAERIADIRPALKVLYVSGHTDDAVLRHGVLNQGTPFLSKPFTPSALGRKVREVLDQPEPEPGEHAMAVGAQSPT
jgi:PAS domain S-box-containing protein